VAKIKHDAQKPTAKRKPVKYEYNGVAFDMTFVLLFRGHLVKYNYILIFYNIDTMADQSTAVNTENVDPLIDAKAAPEQAAEQSTAVNTENVDPLIDAKAATEQAAPEQAAAEQAATEQAAADPFAPTSLPPPPPDKVDKTCVVPIGKTAPSEDGDYVMFAGDKYKVFEIKAGAGLPDNIEADAQFFKVVEKPMAGGRRKKQHKSAKKQRKSAKKQRKSAKKQHKSAKKQRKSRSSRRSKK
jgi:hypothetical protein